MARFIFRRKFLTTRFCAQELCHRHWCLSTRQKWAASYLLSDGKTWVCKEDAKTWAKLRAHVADSPSIFHRLFVLRLSSHTINCDFRTTDRLMVSSSLELTDQWLRSEWHTKRSLCSWLQNFQTRKSNDPIFPICLDRSQCFSFAWSVTQLHAFPPKSFVVMAARAADCESLGAAAVVWRRRKSRGFR